MSSPSRRLIVTSRGSDSCSVFSKAYKKSDNVECLDLKHTTGILELDEQELVLRCGAAVTMETLVRFALARGIVPFIQPDFRRMTVGGAIMGTICESSSHHHGHFADTCAWMLVRRGDGEELLLTEEDAAFHDLNGSFGTLCTLLEAGVRCRRCADTVRVSYALVVDNEDGAATGIAALEEATTGIGTCGKVQYVDAIHLAAGWDGPDSAAATVVVCADDAIGAGPKPVDLDVPAGGKPMWQSSSGALWWFEHLVRIARSMRNSQHSNQSEMHFDFVTLESYLFRWDYGAFWMARPLRWSLRAAMSGSYSLPVLMMFLASSPLLRPLVGSCFAPDVLYRMLHGAPLAAVNRKMVICDFHIPVKAASEFVDSVRRTVPISTPLWLCPVRMPDTPSPLAPHGHHRPSSGMLTMNIGIWGRVDDQQGETYSAALEHLANCVGGRKMLYSANFYSREDWDAIFDKSGAYSQMRARWNADGYFPHLFDKTCGIRHGKEANARVSLWQRWWTRLRERLADFLL